MLQNKWERSSLSLYHLKPQPALGFPELISYVPHCIDKGASRALDEGADPVVFVPIVNFKKLTDPCIIDAF